MSEVEHSRAYCMLSQLAASVQSIRLLSPPTMSPVLRSLSISSLCRTLLSCFASQAVGVSAPAVLRPFALQMSVLTCTFCLALWTPGGDNSPCCKDSNVHMQIKPTVHVHGGWAGLQGERVHVFAGSRRAVWGE